MVFAMAGESQQVPDSHADPTVLTTEALARAVGAERDTRSERESRDNKVAVDAAFAAQKEAAAKQDQANLKAIDKSERATAETINTNQQLAMTKIESLGSLLTETRLTITGLVSNKQGGQETRTGIYAAVGFAAVLLGILGTLAARGGIAG